MKQLLIATFMLYAVSLYSQNKPFEISGTILAEEDKTALESATIYLERVKDSSLVTYTISDKNGKFTLEGRELDNQFDLFISYIGYKTYTRRITLNQQKQDLGTINLISDNALDAVVLTSRAPITIKKDTLEFNVSSFKTKKDANVEDLLKQLPGVEVNDAGEITVNGKPVNQILVNGKPFFGNDPTIATRNLSKDIIEKVQVTDTKTKSEAFAGEQGDTENKSINLTISEDKNKGVFGRIAAGAGTDERYEYAGLLNFFDNDRRLSVLAGGNNINSPGFSFGELERIFGGVSSISINNAGGNTSFSFGNRSFGGGQGIIASNNAGANYADDIGEKTEITGDYFFSNSNSENESSTQRENILVDSRFFTNSNSSTDNESNDHSVNLEFDIEIDSTFLINISPSLRYANNTNRSNNNQESFNELEIRTNASVSNSFVETDNRNFTNTIDLTKRFGNKGSFLKFNITNEINDIEVDDFFSSTANIFGTNPSEEIRDQFTDETQDLNRLNTSITYRLPLKAKELFLDLSYRYSDINREEVKSTFDADPNGDFNIFNTDLSTDFEFTNRRSTPALEVRFQKEKWSANFETALVFRTLENRDALRPNLSIERDFTNIEADANFSYRFSPKASIRTGYSLRNSAPNVSQLQPFQDVSDPLNIRTGNPNLEPTNTHSFDFSYNAFDFQKGSGFFLFFTGNFINDQVIAQTTIDENLVRNTTYTNVNGNYRLSAFSSYNKRVKIDSLQTFRYRIGLSTRSTRSVNFNNNVQYASINNTLTPTLRLTYAIKDVLEFSPSYNLTFQKTTFNVDFFDNQDFLSHNLGLRTATFLPKGLEWRNDINYRLNPDVADGFDRNAVFWNSTLAYTLLKDKATLTLKIYDLLDQNTNARRTATANFIQDSQSTVLQQYFLLSFSWKFNTLGSKGETKSNSFFVF